MPDDDKSKAEDKEASIVPPPLPGDMAESKKHINVPNPFKSFFSLTGGSIFYCLSALSIIYGIAKLMGSLLTQATFEDALPCITTLNVYELALLAVLILIVKLRNVTDDAISLVVLISIFLIGSGTIIDVVANSDPAWSLKIGAICLVLGIIKSWLLRRHIITGLSRIYAIGLVLLLYWNFIIPGKLATLMTADNADELVRRSMWLEGWSIMLLGAAIILLQALRAQVRDGRKPESKTPFLHTSGMVWVFALVMFTAAFAHQYLLAYIFDVTHAFGDYIPLVTIIALLSLEFIRYSGRKLEDQAFVIGMVPLGCILLSLYTGSYTGLYCSFADFLWSPKFLLGLMTILSMLYALRSDFAKHKYVALVYLVALVLVWPTVPGDGITLNWKFCLGTVTAYFFVLGLIRRDAHLVQCIVVAVVTGLNFTDRFNTFCSAHDFAAGELTFILIGLGTVMVYLLFGKLMRRWLAAFGFAFLVVPVMVRFMDSDPSGIAAVLGAMIIIGALVWLREHDNILFGVFTLPIFHQGFILSQRMAAWRYILISFGLLAIGMYVSLKKGTANIEETKK